MKIFYLVLSYLVINYSYCLAQDIKSAKITANFVDTQLKEVLKKIETEFAVKFYYQKTWIDTLKINQKLDNVALEDGIRLILNQIKFNFVNYHPQAYIIFRDESIIPNREINADSVKKDETIVIFNSNKETNSQTLTLNGYIKDNKNGESIVGATIYVEELKIGAVANTFGFYSISIPRGKYQIKVFNVGYEPENVKIELKSSGNLNFSLYETAIALKSVTITDKGEKLNISSVEMGKTKINIATIEKIPPFLGEVDVIKSLTLLPGVQTVGENSSGFNIRGGNTDQNLILQDDAMIFNPSHLFGFFSTYNPDLIRDVTLYKGSMPAQFGGRISSVLDVKLREGNTKKTTGKGGIGIIASRLSLETPLKKDKTTLVLGGRISYNNYIFSVLKNVQLRKSSAFFYDANVKLVHRFNDKNKLTISAYSSADNFKLASDTSYSWKNMNVAVDWNTVITPKLFANFTYIYGTYDSKISSFEGVGSFNLNSGVHYHQFKTNLGYYKFEKHQIDFGVSSTLYQIQPIKRSPNGGESTVQVFEIQQKRGIESALYFNDEIKFSSRIGLMLGLRYSFYANIGADTVNTYQTGIPKSPFTITDKTFYESGKLIQTYGGLEPRISFRYNTSEQSSIKMSYTKTRQYIHQISNSAVATPVDIWQISNTHIKPQIADQFALGYFMNFKNNTIETSVEAFYKKTKNILDYKDGSLLFLNPTLEADLLSGLGKSYGLELLIKKNTGNFKGWISYTFSRSFRKVSSDFREETINLGNYYPANYDKPHNLAIVGNYNLSRRVSVNFNFIYSSGRPVTAPSSQYQVGNLIVPNFSERNQYRIPDYHRLDLSLKIEKTHRKATKVKSSLIFSIYNLYSRHNAFSVFFRPNEYRLPQAYKLSIVANILPTITYNFEF